MKTVDRLAEHGEGWSAPFWQMTNGHRLQHTFTGRNGSLHWQISTEYGLEVAHCSGQFSKRNLETLRSLIDMQISTFEAFQNPDID